MLLLFDRQDIAKILSSLLKEQQIDRFLVSFDDFYPGSEPSHSVRVFEKALKKRYGSSRKDFPSIAQLTLSIASIPSYPCAVVEFIDFLDHRESRTNYGIARSVEVDNAISWAKEDEKLKGYLSRVYEVFQESEKPWFKNYDPREADLSGYVRINDVPKLIEGLSSFLNLIGSTKNVTKLAQNLSTQPNNLPQDNSTVSWLARSFCPPTKDDHRPGIIVCPFVRAIAPHLIKNEKLLSRHLLSRVLERERYARLRARVIESLALGYRQNMQLDIPHNQKGKQIAVAVKTMFEACDHQRY